LRGRVAFLITERRKENEPMNHHADPEAPEGALITEQRLKMRALGYNPVPLAGKAVTLKAWQKRTEATEHEIHSWAHTHPAQTNTGILTKSNPAFDVDILSSAEIADAAAEMLAAELAAIGGRVMVRFGRKPKRAILCRTTEPFKKIKVELDSFFTDPDTGEAKYDVIEVLGDGQQLASFGVHPDTGGAYEWVGGAPTYVPASELPSITEADARAIVNKVVATLGERFGINVRTAAKEFRIAAPVAEANTDVATPYGAKALKRAYDAIVNATSHQDDTRNRECYGIGQLVGGGELPEAEALSALQDAAAKMPDLDPARPWDRRLLAKRVADSFMQGKAKPRAAASAVEPTAFKTSFDLRHTEPPLKFPFRETRIAGDTYAVEIARGTDVAKAEFGPEVWAEHGDQIVKHGGEHLHLIHTCDMIYDPLAQFLDAADAFMSRIEKRPRNANRFAPLYERTPSGVVNIPYSNGPWALRPCEKEERAEQQRVNKIARDVWLRLTAPVYERAKRAALLLSSWVKRDIPPRDYMLGNVLCTTSRWLVYGETGVGKTLLGMDLAAATASGRGFLNWRESGIKRRAMYLDGELPQETFKERMVLIAERYGADVEIYGYSRDALEDGEMPPLNTPEGAKWLWREIQLVRPDVIVFDSIMCLLTGSMAEEESWEPVKAMARKISQQRIAQIWLHHTGHDTSKAFGTKTREWEMDTVMSLTKDAHSEDHLLMEFKKARLKTPKNHEQFKPLTIVCADGGWEIVGGAEKKKGGRRLATSPGLSAAFLRPTPTYPSKPRRGWDGPASP
jgi:hypothetical protein